MHPEAHLSASRRGPRWCSSASAAGAGGWLQGRSVTPQATSASLPRSVSCSFLLRVPPRDDQPPPARAHLTHTDRLPGQSLLLALGNCILCDPCPWRVPPAGPVTSCCAAPPWQRPPPPSPLLPLPALATHAAAPTAPSCCRLPSPCVHTPRSFPSCPPLPDQDWPVATFISPKHSPDPISSLFSKNLKVPTGPQFQGHSFHLGNGC